VTLAVEKQQPKPFPWEKEADKFFSRTIPKIENPIDKRINQRLQSIGLPNQPTLDITRDANRCPSRQVCQRRLSRSSIRIVTVLSAAKNTC
jgi:hypothetical protein